MPVLTQVDGIVTHHALPCADCDRGTILSRVHEDLTVLFGQSSTNVEMDHAVL